MESGQNSINEEGIKNIGTDLFIPFVFGGYMPGKRAYIYDQL